MSKRLFTGTLFLPHWRIQFTGNTVFLYSAHASVKIGESYYLCLKDRITLKLLQMELFLKSLHKKSSQSNTTTNCAIHGDWINKILKSDELSGNIQIQLFFHSPTMCYKTKRLMGIFCTRSYGSSRLLPYTLEVNQYRLLSSFYWL